MSIDPEKLMAFVDGELEEAERLEVEQAIAGDPALRNEVERQRQLRATLTGHYGPVAAETVPNRLRAMLGAGPDTASENVTSLAEARARNRALPTWANLAAIAASLAVGVIAGQMLLLGSNDPIAAKDGALVAQGGLAKALETQLASAQPATVPTRIGLTFADHQGRPCRTFESRRFAGLACRDAGRWQIVIAAAATAERSPYRQAGSSPVMETAQQMMASGPFDAEAERAAMQGGWKPK